MPAFVILHCDLLKKALRFLISFVFDIVGKLC